MSELTIEDLLPSSPSPSSRGLQLTSLEESLPPSSPTMYILQGGVEGDTGPSIADDEGLQLSSPPRHQCRHRAPSPVNPSPFDLSLLPPDPGSQGPKDRDSSSASGRYESTSLTERLATISASIRADGPHTPPGRRNEAPSSPFSWDGLHPTSPIVAKDGETKRDVERRKAAKKQKVTLANKYDAVKAARTAEGLKSVRANTAMEATKAMSEVVIREAHFRAILTGLEAGGYTWGDLVEWVSRPSSGQKDVRYSGFFRNKGQVRRTLDIWVSRNSRSGRHIVHEWALDYAASVVSKEARAVTREGILQSRRMTMSRSFLLSFDLTSVHDRIRQMCPGATKIMGAFSTTTRQQHEHDSAMTAREVEVATKRKQRRDRVSTHLLTTGSSY